MMLKRIGGYVPGNKYQWAYTRGRASPVVPAMNLSRCVGFYAPFAVKYDVVVQAPIGKLQQHDRFE
jgi:lipocalin